MVVSRKTPRSIRGKSNHGSILRQPCRYYLKGTCTRTSCEYWHPPECHFYRNETGCEAGDKCLFPHCNVDEQPNKKPRMSDFPKRRESDDKNAVAIVKSVSQLSCLSQDSDALGFLKEQTVSEKPKAKSFGIDSKSTVHTVYATSSKYPRK